jgi:hypothetical protein
MSLDIGKLISGAGGRIIPAQAPLRAQIEWARILDKPTVVELERGSETLPPQTVRLEFDNGNPGDATSVSGSSAIRRLTIFGIENHPTLPDTDIDAWDTFVLEDQEYTVVTVNHQTHGSVQAYCEAIG